MGVPACTRALVTISLTATWAASTESSDSIPESASRSSRRASPALVASGGSTRSTATWACTGYMVPCSVCGAKHDTPIRTHVRTLVYDRWMASYVAPPGWPPQVRPPDAPDWERTAVDWLLDLCPADYRRYTGLRRHVVVLARFAVLHVEANQAAVRRGLSEVRADLRDVASLEVVDAAVQTFQLEEARLLGVRRAVGLVEEALRGRRYVARL